MSRKKRKKKFDDNNDDKSIQRSALGKNFLIKFLQFNEKTILSKRTNLNKISLAFLVLITGIVGGLIIVFSILLLCKYCLNRKHLKEAEQMKLLYETLNQAALLGSNRLYQCGTRKFSRLEPRRSDLLDRYQLPEDQRQIPRSKAVPSDYHTPGAQGVYNQSYHESREQNSNKQHASDVNGNTSTDDDPAEQYLQVDPRCYVRQKSNASITTYRRAETPRLEKGYSINVDTRPSPTSSSLSPYRQSSFDVTLDSRSHNQQSSTVSPAVSTQQDIYFTPRGSSFSVVGNTSTSTPPGSQHLSPPTSIPIRQNSTIEKKDLTVQLDTSGQTSTIPSSIVQGEYDHSRSLEYSSPSNNSTVDKQSRSFDAVHLLRPIIHHQNSAALNRRTKSYECNEEYQPPSPPIAPPPIVIKIPDMRKLVQAAQLSQLKNNELNEYQQNSNRNSILVQPIILNNHNNENITSEDLWRLRQSYQFEEQQQQQQLDGTSPEDLSPDLLTSTSIDSAGAMTIHQSSKKTNNSGGVDDDPSKYEYRRKSSSNLLLPPPEVRRQALRRTFEKRRSCINQSNAKREQQLLNNQIDLDDDYSNSNQSSTIKSTDFSSLLNNFNSKSENSSFDRSLETDFDMQSDTSSRGPNDHFTSIESFGNENVLPDVTRSLFINQRQSSQIDDSGYKSLESQNQTFSLDWMSTDGGESVIYLGESPQQQQRSVDLKDLEQDLNQQQITKNNRPKFHQSFQETSTTLNPPSFSNSNMIEQYNSSLKTNSLANKLVPSSSFNQTASKKRQEFSKDKRHATTNVGFPYLTTTDKYQFSSATIHQVNEGNTKQTSSSTLQVRHPDLRRAKSDQAEILDSSTREFTSHSNEADKYNTYLSSSADGILHSTKLSNPIRLNRPGDSRHIFQRSPSSTTPPVTISPQIEAFRSKRGSISFDNQIPPIYSPTSNPTKTSTNSSVLSENVTKPRLKFSMVRDTTTGSLGSTSPSYSMTLTNDFSVDEKTNRIINECLMQDNNNNVSHQKFPKQHHQRIRQKTFDETIMIDKNNVQKQTQQQARTAFIKQRQHSFIQTNTREQTPSNNLSLHYVDSSEQNENRSNSQSFSSTLIQQSRAVVRRDNSITIGSPAIIVTGYDSGS